MDICLEQNMYGKLSSEFFDMEKSDPVEISFYDGILKNTKGPILYAMCGAGRLLLPLLHMGYQIEGVDYSSAMLEKCRKRALELDLHPILYQQSFTEMSLQKKYEVIMIPGGSFQHIYPREIAIRSLRNAKNHLLNGGKLIIESFIPWEFLYENAQEEKFEKELQCTDGTLLKLYSNSIANKVDQYFVSKNHYQMIQNGKIIETEDEKMPVLWYYHYEMILILESIGLENILVYDQKVGKNPEMTVYEGKYKER